MVTDADISCDVLIAGCGVAGLFCALNLPPSLDVILLSKGSLDECDSMLAQFRPRRDAVQGSSAPTNTGKVKLRPTPARPLQRSATPSKCKIGEAGGVQRGQSSMSTIRLLPLAFFDSFSGMRKKMPHERLQAKRKDNHADAINSLSHRASSMPASSGREPFGGFLRAGIARVSGSFPAA